ncbi:hypothetical protein L6164_030362 [Bauhinia variegata]|uniref:Uncharacterized protein n=1 Tax=Bauhinia variegata TaxID=167791 RepID=A0ACB9LC42_BAUVA|nr:hypothetical protein L6164_030362 [Bauhinia variegata]
MGDRDHKNLINELVQGQDLARQLQISLTAPSSSQETRELLIQKIVATFEKALSAVYWNTGSLDEPPQPAGVAIRTSESPPFSGSPRSEDSDKDFRDQDHSASRKRKAMPKWTRQIRVDPGMGVEGPLDDGYSWRKYGQKDILGAKYPRGYYRCTHKNFQGCLATKQVQRSDEDPNVVEITYRGKHTCTQASNVNGASSSRTQENNQEPNLNLGAQQQNVQQSQELLMSLRAGLRVITDNLDAPSQPSFPPFHFPSTSNINPENQAFPTPMIESNIAQNFNSPSYMSPATSGTTYFSPGGVNNFGANPNFATSTSEINDIISATTSAANSPTVGLDFPIDHFQFDQNFTFDNRRFFS